MPLYKVTFYQLVPTTRSTYVEDELDEMDEDDIIWEAQEKIREYLGANGIESSDLEDPDVEVISA